MKYTWLCLVTLSLMISCATGDEKEPEVAEKPTTGNLFPYEIHQNTLDNGLNVVTVPYESPELASFYIVVRVGSREEVEEGKTGFAHFFEHMMFRGTDKYPKEAYSKALKSMGASANANTWLDRTVYHMTGNADMLKKMFEVEADRFMHLNYSVPDFKVEAGAVKGEYTKNFASPWVQMNEAVNEEAFEGHTYEHTTMGFFRDIVKMPNQYDYSLEFYDRFYRPEYTTILVVGDVTEQEVNDLATEYFGNWERGGHKADIPTDEAQTQTRYTHIQNENFNPMLTLNYKGPAFSDRETDMAAMEVIAALLFSERSDLYNLLIAEEQKALSLHGNIYKTRDPYLFQIAAVAKEEDDLPYLYGEIKNKIEDIKRDGPDSLFLEDVKSNIKYSFAMGIDNPQDIAENLSYFIWLTGDPESINRYYALFDKITIGDVQQVARKYFVNDQLTIGTISSKEEGGIK